MMMVCGLRMGLSMEHMRHMKYTHLLQMLWEYDEMNGDESEEVYDATKDDVRWMMGL